jgi:hypothetical protein
VPGWSGWCFHPRGRPLPFATRDYRTRQVPLSEANFNAALQASCSIPFVLQAVHDIPGAPPGAYWDGGITDYHLHLDYRQPRARSQGRAAPAWCCTRTSRKPWCPAGWTRV